MRRIFRPRDERGVETTAMILVLPFLVVLVLAIIDVGLMFQTRMTVTTVARDLVRNIAAEGGDRNPRTTRLNEDETWTGIAREQLFKDGKCTLSRCDGEPLVRCNVDGLPLGLAVDQAGQTITCTVSYPYEGVNKPLLDSPLGLGFGTLIEPFTVEASARSETGVNG